VFISNRNSCFVNKSSQYICQSLFSAMLFLLVVILPGCSSMQAGGKNVEGTHLFQLGQYNQAIQRFQEAIAANPTDADGYYNLASTYHRLGKANNNSTQLKQAEDLYHQCLEIQNNHTDCYRALAVLFVEKGKPELAFRVLEDWSVRSPNLVDPKIELARLYEEFGDVGTAKTHLEEAIVADTSNARAWSALASLREKSGQYSQALANYQRSYELNNLQPGVAQRIASLNAGLRTTTGAVNHGSTRMVTQPPVGSNR